jgi:phosphatidylinositol alpha-1,6-mannosyltransferase
MKHHFLTIDFPPQTGGVAVYLDGVAQALAQTDDVSVSYYTDIKMRHEYAVSVKTYTYKGKFNWLAATRRIILQRLFGIKIDYLHISHILPLGYTALLLKLFTGTPYVLYTHGLDIMNVYQKPHRKHLAKMILSNAHTVVANSQATAQLVRELEPTVEPVIVHPCPAGDMPTLPAQEVRGDIFQMVTVSRLVKRKGHMRVLKVLQTLAQEGHTDIHYTIIGDGPEMAHIKAYISEYKLDTMVSLEGRVDDGHKAALLAGADVFVMPTIQDKKDPEGFGIVYLEAALYGVPSIGSNHGGVPEAIINNETGVIINNDDELLAVLRDMLTQREQLKEMGERARQRVQDEFSYDKQIKALRSVL